MAIRDPIHGIIPITRLEYEVTVTSLFERLRYIRKAGGAYLVYPGENDNRYAHSLGACHIAYNLLKNAFDHYLKRLKEKEWKDFWSPEYSVDDILQIVRLAGLLHDIGHGPFSHTTESVLYYILKNFYPSEFREFKEKVFGSVHEFYSYKLILESRELRNLLEDQGFNPLDIAILLSKEELEEGKSLLNPVSIGVLRRIINSQIDADRLDNLLRDSHTIGVPYGVIDADSIIRNVLICKIGNERLELVHHIRSLGPIEDLLDARYKMYRWLYYHQRVILVDAILQRLTMKLLEDKIIEPKSFHYTSFVKEEGFFVDDYWLWDVIRRSYKDDPQEYYLAKALMNHDYLPLSLWRTYEEFIELIKNVVEINSPQNAIMKILDLVKKGELNENELSSMIEDKTGIRNLRVLLVWEKPTTPYDWRSGEDILVYISPQRIVPITEISVYIGKLIEMSNEYYPLYIYYYILGENRRRFIRYINKIRRVFLESLREKLIV